MALVHLCANIFKKILRLRAGVKVRLLVKQGYKRDLFYQKCFLVVTVLKNSKKGMEMLYFDLTNYNARVTGTF